MIEDDKLGHIKPFVNPDKCVECKQCEKSCPVLHAQSFREPLKTFVAWAKDFSDNQKSTSGGIATVASKYMQRIGGIVYGATSEGTRTHHIRIDKLEDVEKLRGSKYVQSSVGKCFVQLRTDLSNGLKVLFIGTPCQVAGLHQYLRKEYDGLITIDLICHGVPSEKLLTEHLKYKLGDVAEIKNISFREGGFIMKVTANQEKIYESDLFADFYKDAYFASFMKGFTFRESCYHCEYAKINRTSDMTIGDFWGLGRKFPFSTRYPSSGYSVVLPSTQKGLDFFKLLSEHLYYQERPIEEAIEGNEQLHTPWKLNNRAKLFRYLMNKHISLDKAMCITMLDRYLFRGIRKTAIAIKK